jgi:hypothetical protein
MYYYPGLLKNGVLAMDYYPGLLKNGVLAMGAPKAEYA